MRESLACGLASRKPVWTLVPVSSTSWFLSPQSLELIRKHGFSAALFAPGWVYECLEKSDFFQNQDK